MKQVNGEKLLASLGDGVKDIRGRLSPNAPMDRVTWFRAGGLAELMFQPHDTEDLIAFLKLLPEEVPLTVVGVGSNLLVRDGGIPGVVMRLSAKGFGSVDLAGENRIVAGAICPDKHVAAMAMDNGIGGFHFYLRHSRRHRRRRPHERRRQWRRDARARRRGARARPQGQQACAAATPRWATPTAIRQRLTDLIFTHVRFRRLSGRPRQDPRRDGCRAQPPRDRAADPREDRRLDLQESGRPFRLEADRRGGMPRP